MADPAPLRAKDAPIPGTPAWWAARPKSAPPERRRGRPPRSFEDIVEAASQLVDEEGDSGFNMRLLADRLGTSTATLYRHVTGKEELMVHVVERLLGEVQMPGGPRHSGRGTWQDAMRRMAVQYRGVLARHPNMLPLVVAQLPIGPNALALREWSIATLTGFGFSRGLAARAFTTILQYVVGSALAQRGDPGPAEAAAIGDYYRTLDPEVFPHVVSSADELTAVSPEDGFLAGLQIVLDGIDRARRRR